MLSSNELVCLDAGISKWNTTEDVIVGIATIRFTNRDIDKAFDSVCKMIDSEVANRV